MKIATDLKLAIVLGALFIVIFTTTAIYCVLQEESWLIVVFCAVGVFLQVRLSFSNYKKLRRYHKAIAEKS